MSRFPRPKAFSSEPVGESDGWIWGNNRGGCGEPVRDRNGNQMANLKLAKNQNSPENYNRSNSYERKSNYDYGETDRQTDRQRERYREKDYQSYSDSSSPKRFTALQEMTSSLSPQQKNQKATREFEYREQLRLQIEENQRKKKLEKERVQEEKRRDFDLYHINGERRTSPPREQYYERDRERGREDFRDREMESMRQRDRDREPNEVSRGHREKERRPYSDRQDPSAYPPSSSYATPPRNGRAIPGLENHQYSNRGSEVDDSRSPYSNYRSSIHEREQDRDWDRGSERERENEREPERSYREDGRFISQEEYDNLNTLCNRLMNQQEKLQDEIKQQNEIIKSLQTNSNGRSRSMQQQRQVADTRSKVTVSKPRPSSTNAKKPPGVALNNAPMNLKSKNIVDTGKKIQENRKNIRVAFGCSVIKDEKKDKKPAVYDEYSSPNNQNRLRVPGAYDRPSLQEQRGTGNAFNKLLTSNRGPVVVTYEDEDAMEPSRVGQIGMVELKNASQFIPIKDKKIKKK